MRLPPLRSNPDAGNSTAKAAVLFLALAFFCLVEPADWLLCPFRRLTHLPCPLCGLTHALCALGHGHFRRAVEFNAASPVIFALFVAGLIANLARLGGLLPPPRQSTQPRIFAAVLVLLLGAWAWRLASGLFAG